jgi:phage terminase small subunit
MGKNGELTRKQSMFCAEYRIDFNGTRAAIRAGYSPKTADMQASRLLRNVKVQNEVKRLQEEKIQATGVTAEYVINSLRNVANRCMQEEPVLDREGNPTGEYQFAHSGANKALELLGKTIGVFNADESNKTNVAILIRDCVGETTGN